MCEICDSGTVEDYLAAQDERIAQNGATLVAVLSDKKHPGFIYTVGLSEKGLPDLIFVGSSTPQAANYLTSFVADMLEGSPPPKGLLATGDPRNPFSVPVWFEPADDKLHTHAYGVENRIERIGSDAPARLVQVVMPDMSGRFPWEQGYDWLDQEIGRPSHAGSC